MGTKEWGYLVGRPGLCGCSENVVNVDQSVTMRNDSLYSPTDEVWRCSPRRGDKLLANTSSAVGDRGSGESAPCAEGLDGEAFDGEAFDGEAFDGEAFDGEAFDGEAFVDLPWYTAG